MNLDGKDELVIGDGWAGVTVVWGKEAGWALQQALTSAWLAGGGTAVNGFFLQGAAGDRVGYQNGIGDVNSDGIPDLILGSYSSSPGGKAGAGSAFVVYGKAAGWATTNTLDTTFLNGGGTAVNGFRIDGELAGDASGTRVGIADVKSDGKADLIIGAYTADPNGLSNSGSVYIVFGKTSGWTQVQYDLSTLLL